ncbi:MAG: carotenoid biosynthesis protein [Candidatus Pacebacteria bacterium]|nr:carotenoid biosynthesis protein [Candidatus Paceibacterota bacterium]
MNDFYFYIFEFGAIFAILAILFEERKNRDLLETLILAVLYGIILEVLNVHMSGLYSYGKEFMVQIYNVPLAIGLGWAVIYYISHKSAQNYDLKWWQIPLFMSLIALSIDLVVDVVAIRLGFWSWQIPFNEEWFGVPYDNLFGWLAVIWTFSFFINLSRQNFLSKKLSKAIKYSSVIISPFLLAFQIISYTVLSAVVSGKFTLNEVMALYNKHDYSYAYYPEVQSAKAYILFGMVFLLVLYLIKELYKNRNRISAEVDLLPYLILIFLHFFFLAIIFMEEIYKQLPVLVFISVFVFVAHTLLYLFPAYLLKNRNMNKEE